MTDSKDVGKDLGKTKKEATRNLRRVQLNLPYSQRTTDNVDVYNTYRKEFNITEGTTVSLDLDIQEMPAPCTVNPPEINSSIDTTWQGEYVSGPCGSDNESGYLANWHCVGESNNTGDYEVITTYGMGNSPSSQIFLPYDGCYLIEASWGGYGVSYFKGMGNTQLSVYKQGNYMLTTSDPNFGLGAGYSETGVIAILGPHIYYTPAPNRLIGMVEAKAGDSIQFEASMSGFAKCYPWFGTHLRGMGVPGDGHLKITLIALAEDIGLGSEEYDQAANNLNSKQCLLNGRTEIILNGLVDFYNRLTAKGESPYSSNILTTEEQWANFWADYWQTLNWTYESSYFPYPAATDFRIMMNDGVTFKPGEPGLLNYQTEWAALTIGCGTSGQTYLKECAMYEGILSQIKALISFYNATYSTVGIPFYVAVGGSTEPEMFSSWESFWAWVWDRGYNMTTEKYDMDYVWTQEVHSLTHEVTPWPPPTTIGELNNYLALYTSNVSGCRA